MARYSAEHLKEMIRETVRSEIKRVVAETISEVLSERYLRQLAESAVAARPRGVADLPIMGDEEDPDEPVPRPLANNIRGVGQPHPRFQKTPPERQVKQYNEAAEPGPRALDRNGMLSLFFEGTQPIDQRDSAASEGVPLPVDDHPEEVSHWQELMRGAEQLSEMKKPAKVADPSMEEARIKRMREQLDAKVVA